MSQQSAFDPSRYLSKVGSADYLEVKWRLVWLREIHPDAHIETDLHESSEKHATFKARVSVPGGGSATGWATETYGDFRDFLEKAETKAIGRALAALGFGTQFTFDFDSAIADAPVDRSRGQGGTNRSSEHVNRETGEITRSGGASEKQINFILVLGKQRGFVIVGDDGKEHAHEEQVTAAVNRELGTSYGNVREMSGADARALLDRWAPPKDGQPQPQRPAAPTPIRQESAPVAPVGDDTAWTTLWKELREAGIPSGNIPAATDLIGTWNSDNPAALLATLRMKVASMPRQQGSAGQDRFTS